MKLHLGCGPRYIEGFVHVDILDAEHVDYCAPVDRLPLQDGQASLIYASHLLEHFGRREIDAVLAEWYRVLCPGGRLRVAVPDFRAVVDLYEEYGLEEGNSGLVGLVVGGQRDEYDYHKMIFDEPLLTRFLEGAGFVDVRPWDWRKTEHRHVDDFSQAYLPHMDKDKGTLMSLNLEAVKPSATGDRA